MPVIDLTCTVAGLELGCCIYNASGPRTGSHAALGKIGGSASGAVLSKSATLVGQDGNPLPRYKELDMGGGRAPLSINSEGLPNKGIDYYCADEAVKSGISNGKPYIVSLSGKCLADNLEMFGRACAKEGVSAVELNLACPNVIGHPIIAYDFEQMKTVLDAFMAHDDYGKKPLGIKLPPYFDMPHFEKAASIINQCKGIQFVVSTNTVGNALVVDTHAEQPLIRPKGGFGGVAGGLVKYTALANVKKMRELLRDDIDVIGAGGVCTGTDAFELVLCGATAVQVGTQHMKEGPKCFARIASELRGLMEEKGYEKLSDFRGKLKPWDKARATASRKAAAAKKGTSDGTLSGSNELGGPKGKSSSNLPVWIIAALLAVISILLAERQMMQGKLESACSSEA